MEVSTYVLYLQILHFYLVGQIKWSERSHWKSVWKVWKQVFLFDFCSPSCTYSHNGVMTTKSMNHWTKYAPFNPSMQYAISHIAWKLTSVPAYFVWKTTFARISIHGYNPLENHFSPYMLKSFEPWCQFNMYYITGVKKSCLLCKKGVNAM